MIVFYVRKDHPTGPGLFLREDDKWTPYMNQARPFAEEVEAHAAIVKLRKARGYKWSIVKVEHIVVD
jgi:hypothetical protein